MTLADGRSRLVGTNRLYLMRRARGQWSFYFEVEDWKMSIRETIDQAIETMEDRI